MDEYQKAQIETYYQSRSLKGFKLGVIQDISDLLTGSYSQEHLKSDFESWCFRNRIKPFTDKEVVK